MDFIQDESHTGQILNFYTGSGPGLYVHISRENEFHARLVPEKISVPRPGSSLQNKGICGQERVDNRQGLSLKTFY